MAEMLRAHCPLIRSLIQGDARDVYSVVWRRLTNWTYSLADLICSGRPCRLQGYRTDDSEEEISSHLNMEREWT